VDFILLSFFVVDGSFLFLYILSSSVGSSFFVFILSINVSSSVFTFILFTKSFCDDWYCSVGLSTLVLGIQLLFDIIIGLALFCFLL